MEFYNNRINNNLQEKGNNYPIYLRNSFDKGSSPLLMKEKFFNLKVIQTPNKYKQTSLNTIDNKFIRNTLDVRDINFKENHLFKRKTNPLEPNYRYDWQMAEINEDRKINYINFNKLDNHPKELYPFIKNHKDYSLNTLDIPGSQTGTTSHISKLELKFGKKLKYKKDDILGSHPGSLIKGIKTNRNTNPLEPNYHLFYGKLYEYGKEAKEMKNRYNYKSLLDYYNKYSKKNFDEKNHDRNKMNIKNEINIEINKSSRNKNFLEGFGRDNKFYPREKFKTLKYSYDFIIDENDKDYINLI